MSLLVRVFSVNCLYLFLHRRQGGKNIGDKGPIGLEEFKRQHKCNIVCEKIPLCPISETPTATVTPKAKSSGTYNSIYALSASSHFLVVNELPPTFRVRLGCGVIDVEDSTTTHRKPRGYVRYTGASYSHFLAIDSADQAVFGPFETRIVRLSHYPESLEAYNLTHYSG